MIDIRDLEKRFSRRIILSSLSLIAAPGEVVLIVGRNGSGKTTLLRVMAGLTGFQAGSLTIAGCTLPSASIALRRRIGFLSHHPQLYDALTAVENLQFFNRLHAHDLTSTQLDLLLDRVGLLTWRDERVRHFSRGMLQRLDLARVSMAQPDVLLLDEPGTGLDEDGLAILGDILEEVRRQDRIALLTSHQAGQVKAVTRSLVLERGSLHAFSTPTAGKVNGDV